MSGLMGSRLPCAGDPAGPLRKPLWRGWASGSSVDGKRAGQIRSAAAG
jgi:hypothetical protein